MVENSRSILLKHIADLEENYPLSKIHPLGLGGTADYFTVAKDSVQLASAIHGASLSHLPYLVIGSSTSILFSDGGFPGLVINNQTTEFALANDRSQVVVDSGMSLRHFITHTASRGFGGVTHLYTVPGTVGGAVYANESRQGHAIYSVVRHVTLIMPPTKLHSEPTIVRYKTDWLEKSPEGTRLQWMKKQDPLGPQPIILNVHFQLTSVRSDELLRRINREVVLVEEQTPDGAAFGPLFAPVPGVEVEELIRGARAAGLRYEHVFIDRRRPNFVRVRGRGARAEQVVALMHLVQEKVRAAYAVDLVPAFELLGVW